MKIINTIKIILFSALLSPLCSSVLQAQENKSSREAELKSFVQKMVTEHQFNEAELTTLLDQAEIKDTILQAISRPAEGVLPWHKYKNQFLSKQRIQEGAEFWHKNQKILNRAYKEYGVPPEIIVGIIGVETFYGKQKGRYRVLDSLVTLGFEYPPRAPFFRSELEEFLLMTREENLDPTQVLGSYAGAMGMPQFISSSYRRFAVDFSGKGKRDLINNTEDAIGSVANYFIKHGWKANEPVIAPALTTKLSPIAQLEKSTRNPEPKYTVAELAQKGIRFDQTTLNKVIKTNAQTKSDPKTRVAIVELEETTGPTYWLGFNNFYVITRYNHSNHYAMAVYQLAQEVKAHREQQYGKS